MGPIRARRSAGSARLRPPGLGPKTPEPDLGGQPTRYHPELEANMTSDPTQKASHRILMALDDSAASQATVEYAAQMVAGRPDHYVHLVHVLPPMPEASVGEAREKGRVIMTGMKDRLHAAGLDDDHVDTGFLLVPPDTSMVEGLLDLARDQSCTTIAVGRSSLPWHRELLHHHPADELVKKAHGFTLWVVE